MSRLVSSLLARRAARQAARAEQLSQLAHAYAAMPLLGNRR